MNKSIENNILRHSGSSSLYKRNFIIKKQKYFNKILQILKYEADQNACEALNTLGFLQYHGISVQCNQNLAFEYFKRAAIQNDSSANFACFCLESQVEKKYDYLESEILKCNPKIMTTLGYLIFYN